MPLRMPSSVFSSINRRGTGFPNNTFVSPSNCVHESRDRCEFIEFARPSFHGGRGGTTFRGRKICPSMKVDKIRTSARHEGRGKKVVIKEEKNSKEGRESLIEL